MFKTKKIIVNTILFFTICILITIPDYYYKYYFNLKEYDKANKYLNINIFTTIVAYILISYLLFQLIQVVQKFKEKRKDQVSREKQVYDKFGIFDEVEVFNKGIDRAVFNKCISEPSISNDISIIKNIIEYDKSYEIKNRLEELSKNMETLEVISETTKNEFKSGIDDLTKIYFPSYITNTVEYLNEKEKKHKDIEKQLFVEIYKETDIIIDMINNLICEINEYKGINQNINVKALEVITSINGYKKKNQKEI